MTICPCCGSKVEGDLRVEGCAACGARAVGPPLARPERELPAYGRPLLVAAAGALLLASFVAATLAAFVERESFAFKFWDWVAAAETAAWRMKWTGLPAALVATWAGLRVCAKIRREPGRYAAAPAARVGLAMSASMVLAFLTLVGVTIPERMRQRELGLRAADNALLYATARVFNEYRARYGTHAASVEELRRGLCEMPDADGSVARVLEEIEAGVYSPSADLAAAIPPKNGRGRGGRRIKVLKASAVSMAGASTDTATAREGLTYTNYELLLPGRDKVLGTADDLSLRDGMIVNSPKTPKQPPGSVSKADPGAQ